MDQVVSVGGACLTAALLANLIPLWVASLIGSTSALTAKKRLYLIAARKGKENKNGNPD